MQRRNVSLILLLMAIFSAKVQTVSATDKAIIAEHLPRAEIVSQRLLKELSTALTQQIQQAGVDSAVDVCSTLAPQIVNRLSIETGWRITRIGTRVRNALLGTPDHREGRALRYFQQQKAAGRSFKEMRFSAVTDEPSGKYYRYMRPLVVKHKCLVCHGDATKIPSSIKDKYPHDLAIDYKVGELRGAVSIKIPLTD